MKNKKAKFGIQIFRDNVFTYKTGTVKIEG